MPSALMNDDNRRCLSAVKGQRLLEEFEAVLRENVTTMRITERRNWWSSRNALNTRLGVSHLFVSA